MSKKLKTAGDLREFLCEAIQKVESGVMDFETARNITKLAGQVNESIYAEAKVTKLNIETNKPIGSFGSMQLGN